MPEKFYHTLLKQEIKAIAEKSKRYSKINQEKKIPIPHPNQELVFHYKPELTLITKFGKKYIFEVLDDQLNDHNLIIADIIQAYLVENISKLIFISKNVDGYNLTKKLSRVIGAKLEESGFFKRLIPEVCVYTISYAEVKSTKISSILKRFAKEDGWN